MYIDEDALPVSFQALILIEILPKQEPRKKSAPCEVRDVKFELSQCFSVEVNRGYVDENALPVSLQALILIRLSPKRKCLKHFSCQVRDVELELSQCCSMDLNIDVPRLKRFACQRPKS